MTEQEFDKTKWRMVSHLSCEDHHSSVYRCEDIPNLTCCKIVNFKNGEPTRGGTTHYMLNGKVYKSKQKLLEVLNDDKGI